MAMELLLTRNGENRREPARNRETAARRGRDLVRKSEIAGDSVGRFDRASDGMRHNFRTLLLAILADASNEMFTLPHSTSPGYLGLTSAFRKGVSSPLINVSIDVTEG